MAQPTSAVSFDGFVPTAGSSEALALARALAANAPGAPRLLLLVGPPGVGKTHLLLAIAAEAGGRSMPQEIVSLGGTEFLETMLAGLRPGGSGSPRETYGAASVLTLDDLHVVAQKPMTQRETGSWLSSVVRRGLRVACACSCAAATVPVLAAAVHACAEGRVVEMQSPQPDEMARIVGVLAATAGLRIDRKTLRSIAGGCHGDVRAGMGALSRVRLLMSGGIPAA